VTTALFAAFGDTQDLWRTGWGLVQTVVDAARWVTGHLTLLALLGTVLLAAGQVVQARLADAASRRRVRFRLPPAGGSSPTPSRYGGTPCC